MDPIAFHLGPLAIRWYGILIALAFLIGILGAGRGVRKSQTIREDDFYSLTIFLMLGAIIGARLYYVLFEWDYYGAHPQEIVAVWNGGLAVHGGLLVGLAVLLLGARHYRFDFWELADILAPFVILGQAIGRWGNYFNQEAYGYLVDPEKVPWAMYIDGGWRHPTFLYESLWNAAGFVFLLLFGRRPSVRRGDVLLAYLMYYSLGRFFVEGFRTDSLMLGPLRMAQAMSLGLFLIGLVLFLLRRRTTPHQTGSDNNDDG